VDPAVEVLVVVVSVVGEADLEADSVAAVGVEPAAGHAIALR
jgi:hypothetical protein